MESSPAVGSFQKAATLAIACLAVLLLTVDLTVLHLAVPALVTDLGPSGTQILWIADIYGFVVAGLLITMGSIGDRIGRKRLLLLGTGAFAVASVLSAYAPSAELLIVARTLLGVAGAAIMPSTLSIIRNVFTDPKQRTAAIGVWSGVSASGFVVGPIVGGLLLDSFWWGSVFLINLPILLAIAVAGFLILPESRDPSPGRLDPLSVVLSVGGVIAVVYAVKEAAKDGVAQVGVGVAALVGVVALTVFVKRQTRLSHPLIDVRLFRRIAFSGAISTNMFAMFAMVAQSLIFAQYFQSVLGWSPLKAGLAGLPGAAGATLGGVLAAPLITAIGRARVVFLGMGLAAVGISCYTMAGLTLNYPVFVLAMVPAGTGLRHGVHGHRRHRPRDRAQGTGRIRRRHLGDVHGGRRRAGHRRARQRAERRLRPRAGPAARSAGGCRAGRRGVDQYRGSDLRLAAPGRGGPSPGIGTAVVHRRLPRHRARRRRGDRLRRGVRPGGPAQRAQGDRGDVRRRPD
ncbi:MFS transporter [Streptomyces sp. GLT-R25]